MASKLTTLRTELNGQAINVFQYGYSENKTLAAIFYDMKDLNKSDIDWKAIKPKPAKVKINSLYIKDATSGQNKVTWQEVDVKDQLMTVNTYTSATQVTLDVVGPISFKRGEKLINVSDQTVAIIAADASTATVGATTLVVTAVSGNDFTGWAASEAVRLGGYSKPYGNNEGNTFDSDTYAEEYNLFQGANMTITLDQVEMNSQKIMYNTVGEYLKDKFNMASRRMLRGIMRDFYMGFRGYPTVGSAAAYSAGGLDYFIRNVSGVAGVNLGSATGAGTGEIKINGADNATKRGAVLDAFDLVFQSGIPNISDQNKLVVFCTSSFLRAIDDLFYDKLVMNDSLDKIGLTVKTVMFNSGAVTFIMDSVLNDLQKTSATVIKKVAYTVPIDYIQMFLLANDVETKEGKSVNAMGYGKIFVSPQTAEESNSIRLYTSFSRAFGMITSGAYRKIILDY